MKKTIIPEPLDSIEQSWFNKHINMDRYWFDAIFKEKLRYVDQTIIHCEGLKWEIAYVYSVDATINAGTETEQPGVYCFLIFCNDSVWKTHCVENVAKLLDIISKERKREDYEDQQAIANYKKEKRLSKQKVHSKLKRIGSRKKAA